MDQQKPNYPKTVVDLPQFTLVGVVRNIKQKEEIDPNTGQIGKTYEEYFGKELFNQIPNRTNPMRTYCVYYEYQDPENHEEISYKMLLGEQVNLVSNLPEGFQSLVIPPHTFCKIAGGPGQIPKIVIDAWQSLCTMTNEDFGGKRIHSYDFEVYPETTDLSNPNATFDLYIGIAK